MTGIYARQLPVRFAPCTDELLSSWIIRHAAFYAISPLAMLRHCLPEVLSLRTADLDLPEDQVDRIASMFSVDPATVRRMTFTNVPQSSRRLIAGEPRQSCSSCLRIVDGSNIILRSQLLGWRITCPLCGGRLQTIGGSDRPSPFSGYHHAALIGEGMLNDEAEHGIQNWFFKCQTTQSLQTKIFSAEIGPVLTAALHRLQAPSNKRLLWTIRIRTDGNDPRGLNERYSRFSGDLGRGKPSIQVAKLATGFNDLPEAVIGPADDGVFQ